MLRTDKREPFEGTFQVIEGRVDKFTVSSTRDDIGRHRLMALVVVAALQEGIVQMVRDEE